MLSRAMGAEARPPCTSLTAEQTASPKVVVATPVGSFGEDSVFEHVSPSSPSLGAAQRNSLGGADNRTSQEGLFEAELDTEPATESGVAAPVPLSMLGQAATVPVSASPAHFNMAFGW